MRIEQLRLNNFKIFKNACIDFKPLTLITGANSSGKSTILNAITAILQSQLSNRFPFEFISSGKNASLGSYKDIVHEGRTKTKFSIRLQIRDKEKVISIDTRYRYSAIGEHILPDHIVYKLDKDKFELNWLGKEQLYSVTLCPQSYYETITGEFSKQLMDLITTHLETKTDTKAETKAREKREAIEDFEKLFSEKKEVNLKIRADSAISLIEQIGKNLEGRALISSMQNVMYELKNNFNYIGPVRVYPSRFYLSEESSQDIEPTGKNSIALLNQWKRYYKHKYSEVIKSIQLLELASEVEIKAGLDEILTINIKPYGHKEVVNYADVGFGISQILPILIADVALPHSGTLLVNQPEVHLHPASQALLGNYFTSKLKNRNYIVETHSEYLINRLRRLVVEDKVNTDDISILFIEMDSDKHSEPEIYNIELNKDGSLKNAPKSFFETYYLDTFNIALGGFAEGD